mmetsp:Transcript_8613/g.13080  ORF Transcript_8613/g.13080 Transcript_8613/m.13080 type:complete len:188 (-) Transcript_8613:26-589(-)
MTSLLSSSCSGWFLLILFVTSCCCGDGELFSINPRHILFDGHPFVRKLDHNSVLPALNRKQVCTLLLLGAKWDGHFKRFVERGYWQQLSEELHQQQPEIEVTFLEYSGESEGIMSIPTEILDGKRTIGSYEWFMFRDGKRVEKEGERRVCFTGEFFDIDCLQSMCDRSLELEEVIIRDGGCEATGDH